MGQVKQLISHQSKIINLVMVVGKNKQVTIVAWIKFKIDQRFCQQLVVLSLFFCFLTVEAVDCEQLKMACTGKEQRTLGVM